MDKYSSINDFLSSSFGIAAIIIIVILILIWLAIAVFYIISLAKLFKKAGKPGWAAIIPYYNKYTILDISGYNWYYIFIYIAPIIVPIIIAFVPILGSTLNFALSIVVILFNITSSVKLAKAFGKDTAYGIGIAFVSIVFIPMLAFNKNVKYVGKTVNGDIDFNNLF